MNNSENNAQNEVFVKMEVEKPEVESQEDKPVQPQPQPVQPVVVGVLYTNNELAYEEEQRKMRFRLSLLKFISFFVAAVMFFNVIHLFHASVHTTMQNVCAGVKGAVGLFGIISLARHEKFTAVKMYAIVMILVYVACVGYEIYYTYDNEAEITTNICQRLRGWNSFIEQEKLRCRNSAWFSLRAHLLFKSFYCVFAFILTWKYANAGIAYKKEVEERENQVVV